MTAGGCVGVSVFGTIDDNFYNIQWMDSIEVSYNPETNQTTYKGRTHTAAIHFIQQRRRLQALTIVGILQEETEGKIIGPAIDTKCKIDTGTAVNVMPISTFRKLCPAMFDTNGNVLHEFNKDWTTLRAYGGGINKHFGTRMIKCKWNYQKWVFLFHIVNAEGPTFLGLKTLIHMGIFSKHPRVYFEIIDLHSMNLKLASKQPKEGEDMEIPEVLEIQNYRNSGTTETWQSCMSVGRHICMYAMHVCMCNGVDIYNKSNAKYQSGHF